MISNRKKSVDILVLLLTILILLIIFVAIIVIPIFLFQNHLYQPGPINLDNKNIDIRIKILQEDYPEIELPENITNDLAEIFMDILWDLDGDSGFEGILPLAFSYIPFLGSNGEIFAEILFLLSISLGIIIVAMRVRRGIF